MLKHLSFGDIITMDHANANKLIHSGLARERELLIVSDLATGSFGAYPVGSESAGRVVIALVHFLGHDAPKAFHTYRAPEFVSVVRILPGGPSRTGRVLLVIRGTRTLLHEAGLPHCWWPFASRCNAALHNFATTRGACPMAPRHGGAGFSGPLIPFGALVHAMPSGIHRKRNLKFEPPLLPAVFLGYVVQDGGKSFGEFIWAFVDDLADRPSYSRARWSECRVMVRSGCELRFDTVGEATCPCAELYRWDHDGAAGVRRCWNEAAEADEDSNAQACDEDGRRD